MAPTSKLSMGIKRASRSHTYHHRGLWPLKAKHGGAFPNAEKPAASAAEPKFYPADGVKPRVPSTRKPKPTKLMSTITPGTVLILLAGRYMGKRVVFLKQLKSGLLLITGPFKINGVPIHCVNQAYVIATSTKVDISGVNVEKFDDKYFARDKKKKAKKPEGELFETEEEATKNLPDFKKDDQKAVDAELIKAIESVPDLKTYLGARFSLRDGDKPRKQSTPHSSTLCLHSSPPPSCLPAQVPPMAKKRKRSSDGPAAVDKPDDSTPLRPERTLFGFKDQPAIEPASGDGEAAAPPFHNKEKVLVTCSRRIIYRYRHMMQNMVSLLPHAKKDSKVESKQSKGNTLNELLELRSCSSCLFFECRKQKDLYLWMVKFPGGPSIKFLVNAVHTMEELRLTGNHLKGSRPLLTFSSNFDQQPHWKLVKEMLTQIFATPKDHQKSKPFHDHVFVFSIVDDHVWFRNYQISVPHNEIDKVDKGGLDKMTLIEVGPRFCLNPIKMFGGTFGGPTFYENPYYVSPNQIRALEKGKKAGKYAKKVKAKVRRKMHEMENVLEPDEFADLWKGEDGGSDKPHEMTY